MEVKCTFIYFDWIVIGEQYTCWIGNQDIPEGIELKFKGEHGNGKGNEDVTGIRFENCTVTKVPQNLTETFPNLKVLSIWNSKLKNLTKDDLSGYKQLQVVSFIGNELEFLPGDLFEGFDKLEVISFQDNNLKIIEPNILDGFRPGQLKVVDFSENPNYDKCYSTLWFLSTNATLEIKNELVQKYPQLFKELKNSNETLSHEVHQFKQQNAALKNEIDDFKHEVQQLTTEIETFKFFISDIQNFIELEDSFRDFTVNIEDKQFRVHKWLLAARSQILAETFSNNPDAGNLNLIDIPADIFEKILKFIYTDELPRGYDENFLSIFAAAGRLQIKELRKFAAEKLMDQVGPENALEILKLSNKYGHDELRQKAFEEVKKNYPKIMFEDEWIADDEKVEKLVEYLKKIEQLELEMAALMK